MLAPRRVGKTSLMLELQRAPRPDWDVIYLDLESGDSPADCFAAILAGLADHPKYRSWLETIPFRESVGKVLRGLSASADFGVVQVEIKRALAGDWEHAAVQLHGRLARLPDGGARLVLVLDELPILVSRVLKTDTGGAEAGALLSRLREMRQAPDLRNRVLTLVGGSIGLEGILRRAGLSGMINDLSPLRVKSWDRPTAVAFLSKLGQDNEFPLGDGHIDQMLDLLREPVPYHVQLLFSEVHQASRGIPGDVTPEAIERCFRERLAGTSGTSHLDHQAVRLETTLTEQEREMAQVILGRAGRSKNGANFTDVRSQPGQNERLFLSVIRELEAEGYVECDEGVVRFRSNLLREWWRRNQPTARIR